MKCRVLFFVCFFCCSFLNAYNMFKCEGENIAFTFEPTSITGGLHLSFFKNGKLVSFDSVATTLVQDGIFVSAKKHESPSISFTVPTDQKTFSIKVSSGCTYFTVQCAGEHVQS
jgi:hypothetical protein